eukprot:7528309-Karenia_brevis.AAC.1
MQITCGLGSAILALAVSSAECEANPLMFTCQIVKLPSCWVAILRSMACQPIRRSDAAADLAPRALHQGPGLDASPSVLA